MSHPRCGNIMTDADVTGISPDGPSHSSWALREGQISASPFHLHKPPQRAPDAVTAPRPWAVMVPHLSQTLQIFHEGKVGWNRSPTLSTWWYFKNFSTSVSEFIFPKENKV